VGKLVRMVAAVAFAASAAFVSSAVRAQSADVGLVNLLQGDVSYASEGAGSAKAQAFMKVRQGDKFTVPAGALVRVVYFDGGRMETWKGPASFSAGAKAGSGGTPSEVATLPTNVPQRIAQVPDLMQVAKLGRSGGVPIREVKAPGLTAQQRSELASAKDTYKKMRATSPADDITPELFLYSVLQDLLLYDEMKPVVEEMAKRQPSSSEVQDLASWVKSRTQ